MVITTIDIGHSDANPNANAFSCIGNLESTTIAILLKNLLIDPVLMFQNNNTVKCQTLLVEDLVDKLL
jgi:hypothetical protein